jgi:uncharacterized membrane protein
MKYLIYAVVVAFAMAFPWMEKIIPSSPLSGTITYLSEPIEEPLPHKKAKVLRANDQVEAVVYLSNVEYKTGDKILLQEDAQFEGLYSVSDYVRTPALIKLFVIFMMVILLVSGVAGVRSLLGLLFSFTIIFKFVLPQIIAGSNPLSVALLASMLILCVSYFLTHGINHKSVIAIIGTLGALCVTGILAVIYGASTKLSGFGTEEVSFLVGNLAAGSFYNLYLAGIIIGSLGVLDDITISQASIVAELSHANHKLGIKDLYLRAMRVGHDHISSLVNTLVLVYAGSALPLLLLFVVNQATPIELLNYETVAEEIVRTLVGSIGLVSAVPLTTLVAAYWYGGKR